MYGLRELVVLSAVALFAGPAAAAASAVSVRTQNPLAVEVPKPHVVGVAEEGMLAARRSLRGAVGELTAKALSLVRLTSGQVPGLEHEDAKQAADMASNEGIRGMLLLDGWEIVIQIVLGLVLLIAFAFLYKKYKPSMLDDDHPTEDNGKPEELDGEWKYSFFGCCGAPKMCCIACCFPAVRWADTVDMAKLMTFWPAVAAWWVLSLFNLFVGFAFAFVTGILGAYHRQKIRGIFNIENCTPGTIVIDFFAYCLCPCLAIVQEGRTIEEAYRVKHKGVEAGFMEGGQ